MQDVESELNITCKYYKLCIIVSHPLLGAAALDIFIVLVEDEVIGKEEITYVGAEESNSTVAMEHIDSHVSVVHSDVV